MKIEDIPSFVRCSGLYTEDQLEILASVSALPTEWEVDSIRHHPEVQELTNAFIGDESARLMHQLLKGKECIERGDIEFAWKIILL